MKKIFSFVCLVMFLSALVFAEDLSLPFQSREHMPNEAKPRVYWWWLNSVVSEAGITSDLEELAAKGIGGVMIFDAGGAAGEMPVPDHLFMSEGWRKRVVHAVKEADRLGLEVSINLCSGWDAGGPWITPEFASKHTVFHQQQVTGPGKFQGKLAKPEHFPGFYQDLGIYAVPVTEEEKIQREWATPKVTASSSQEKYQPQNLLDGNRETFWVSDGWKVGDAPTPEKPEWILLEYPEKYKAKQLRIDPRVAYGPKALQLQISDDGQSFQTVATAAIHDGVSEVISFDEVATRFYHILITASHSPLNVQISDFRLGLSVPVDVAKLFRAKAARGIEEPVPACNEIPLKPFPAEAGHGAWKISSCISLLDKLNENDELDWDIPQGEWTILRVGVAPTGHPFWTGSAGVIGLEMDWLSKDAMDFHFKSMAEVIINDLKEAGLGHLVGKTLKYFHDDSWEVGTPNCTTGFIEEFKARRGYDPVPYLPTLAGHFVESSEVTDRFLYDYRKTVADCLSENHFKRLNELAKQHGMGTHCEGAGPCYPITATINGLQNLGFCDVPMGEFWHSNVFRNEQNQHLASKVVGCAAHIYGKQFAAAEAFTGWGHWIESPEDLKPTGDTAFCEGINRYFFHTSTATRPEDGKPGMEYGAGTHFNQNVTWWQKAGAFVDYISRCQYLLSRGLFVADVCCYQGDFAPNFVPWKHVFPTLGLGFDYDVCDTTVLMQRMEVKDGRIVLPDGMSYAVLVLPERTAMPLEILEKVGQLVRDGATVVGTKPQTDPGLFNYPNRDSQVKKLADTIWGSCDGKTVTRNRYGRGKVVWGESLKMILQEQKIGTDFSFQTDRPDSDFDFIHRETKDASLYFVVNRKPQQESAKLAFRVAGKTPEIWNPITGEIVNVRQFETHGGVTSFDCAFDANESLFVVFRSQEGVASSVDTENRLNTTQLLELTGSWDVAFDLQWGGPDSVTFDKLHDWAHSDDKGIKYYSGAAVYRKTFTLDSVPDGTIFLELGSVKNVAEVSLNGQKLGVVWTAPWRVDISGAIKTGENHLEISVTNLWPNRLIGDASLPVGERVTKTNVRYSAEGTLLPSGLLGPVTLQRQEH